MIDGCSHTIDVTTRISSCSANLFERSVVRRIPTNALAFVRVMRNSPFRQSEIEQNHFTSRSQLQVLWFDVSVNNRGFLRMQIFESVKQLIGPAQYLRGYKDALPPRFAFKQQLFQVFPRNVLHYQKLFVANRKIIGNNRQRSMAQPIK